MSVLLPSPVPYSSPADVASVARGIILGEHGYGLTVEVRVQPWAAHKPWLISAAFMRPAAMVPCVRRAPGEHCPIPPGPIRFRPDAPD